MKVYFADVQSLKEPSKYAEAYRQIDEERQKKVDRFHFEKDRLLSLGAGLLLKKALDDENIKDRKMGYTTLGKPFLINHPALYFNLSHSGEKVLCVMGRKMAGCDIEVLGDIPHQIIGRVFSEEEQAYLKTLKEENLKREFFRLWTGKESFLKMTGEGLSHDPRDFSIKLPFGKQTIGSREVTFFEIPCGADYQATICMEGDARREEIRLEEIFF